MTKTDFQNKQPEIVFLSTNIDERGDALEGLRHHAEQQGLSVSEKLRPNTVQIYASPIWMAIAPFALFLIGPVYNDVYQWLKAKVPSLWNIFFNANNSKRITAALVTSNGPVDQNWSVTFSIFAEFSYGRVKLVFPNDCSEEDMKDMVGRFAKLMYHYARGECYDGIGLDNEEHCYYGMIIVAFDSTERTLRVLNPLESLPPKHRKNIRQLEKEKRRRVSE